MDSGILRENVSVAFLPTAGRSLPKIDPVREIHNGVCYPSLGLSCLSAIHTMSALWYGICD